MALGNLFRKKLILICGVSLLLSSLLVGCGKNLGNNLYDTDARTAEYNRNLESLGENPVTSTNTSSVEAEVCTSGLSKKITDAGKLNKKESEVENKELSADNSQTSEQSNIPAVGTNRTVITAVEKTSLEKAETLWSAITMMAHYGVYYSEDITKPGIEFWNKFCSALVVNSWFDPFDGKSYSKNTIWTNGDITKAAVDITGNKEIVCSTFEDGIDRSQAYSPYLYDSSIKNMNIKKIDNRKYEIYCDMLWLSTSMDETEGVRHLHVVIVSNADSPLDGYSIVLLNGRVEKEPVASLAF